MQGYQEPVHVGVQSLQIDFVDVAPAPVFATLGGLDEGMAGLVEVGAGVAVFRRVATAHLAAFQAHAQVDPGIAGLEAFFAAPGVGLDLLQEFRDVRAVRCHFEVSFSCVVMLR
jgi:hypothetical protein